MKLRNKKTGEIAEFVVHKRIEDSKDGNQVYAPFVINPEEWEDYKEPKYYWYIDDAGVIQVDQVLSSEINMRKSIGNYFETEEEAELAVRKLKAWKRLKDKGFRFERWLLGGEYGNTITFSDYIECNDETRAELDLLFGGEE